MNVIHFKFLILLFFILLSFKKEEIRSDLDSLKLKGNVKTLIQTTYALADSSINVYDQTNISFNRSGNMTESRHYSKKDTTVEIFLYNSHNKKIVEEKHSKSDTTKVNYSYNENGKILEENKYYILKSYKSEGKRQLINSEKRHVLAKYLYNNMGRLEKKKIFETGVSSGKISKYIYNKNEHVILFVECTYEKNDICVNKDSIIYSYNKKGLIKSKSYYYNDKLYRSIFFGYDNSLNLIGLQELNYGQNIKNEGKITFKTIESFKYDSKGNEIEKLSERHGLVSKKLTFNSNYEINTLNTDTLEIVKWKYDYHTDLQGNWIKKTGYLENQNKYFIITERKIDYY